MFKGLRKHVMVHAGARVASPVPVPTVLVTEAPATAEKPQLFGGLLKKKTLNTFPTPEPTPEETPAPDASTLKELLIKACACLSTHCANRHCSLQFYVKT